MNHLAYASDMIGDAASLLTVTAADVDMHYGALRRAIRQLELLREAICLQDSLMPASNELRMNVKSMLGDDVDTMNPDDLLDEYVSCRLESVNSALCSIGKRYLESNERALMMIGGSIFEAGQWIDTAHAAIYLELECRFTSVHLAA